LFYSKYEKAICSGHTNSFLVSPPLNYVNWNENIHFVPDFSLGSKAVWIWCQYTGDWRLQNKKEFEVHLLNLNTAWNIV